MHYYIEGDNSKARLDIGNIDLPAAAQECELITKNIEIF